MKIQPIGKQLKAFRLEHKKTLAFVAEKIGATSSYVSQLENGVRNPSDGSLFEILTKAFEVDENSAENLIRAWRINQYTSGNQASINEKAVQTMLPLYKEINKTVDATEPAEMRSFYLSPSLNLSKYFLWEMNDNSMEPNIPQGTLLLLSKEISDVPYHGIILTKVGNNITARHYEKQPDRIKLIPANRNFPVFFGKDVSIFGVVKQMLIDI